MRLSSPPINSRLHRRSRLPDKAERRHGRANRPPRRRTRKVKPCARPAVQSCPRRFALTASNTPARPQASRREEAEGPVPARRALPCDRSFRRGAQPRGAFTRSPLVPQELTAKRHIRRDRPEGLTHCGRPAQEGDLKLARFFRELEVLRPGSNRQTEFLASMCEKCSRTHLAAARR